MAWTGFMGTRHGLKYITLTLFKGTKYWPRVKYVYMLKLFKETKHWHGLKYITLKLFKRTKH